MLSIRMLHGDQQVKLLQQLQMVLLQEFRLGTATITAISQSDTTITSNMFRSCYTFNRTGYYSVSGDITANTTWYANAKYMLSGFVYVKNNATLTIEPGTIIKGVSGTKGNSYY